MEKQELDDAVFHPDEIEEWSRHPLTMSLLKQMTADRDEAIENVRARVTACDLPDAARWEGYAQAYESVIDVPGDWIAEWEAKHGKREE